MAVGIQGWIMGGVQGQHDLKRGNSRSRGTADPSATKSSTDKPPGQWGEVRAPWAFSGCPTPGLTRRWVGPGLRCGEIRTMVAVQSQRVARYLAHLMEGSRNGGCLKVGTQQESAKGKSCPQTWEQGLCGLGAKL